MMKLMLREKAQIYLTEIENGKLCISGNWLVYGIVNEHNYVKKVGERVGYEHNQCKGCWYCQLQIGNQRIMIALSYIMFAYYNGIDSIHQGMEIRFRDGDMFNFTKENMIDGSNKYGIDVNDLNCSITRRLEVMLLKINDGIYEVKSGKLYHNAIGKNVSENSEVGCLDNNGYIQHRINAFGNMYRVRLHQVLYAYYHGLEKFDENMVIHHKDGNKSNNLEENLEQITYVENARGSYSIEKTKFYTKDKIKFVIDKINLGKYEIDVNKGMLYHKTNAISFKAGNTVGCIGDYHRMSFRVSEKKYSIALHNVIYYYVHGIDNYIECTVIDHIDNNKLNNSVDNLQQITHRENSKKGNRK